MVQWVKVLGGKSVDLSSNPGTYIMEGEDRLPHLLSGIHIHVPNHNHNHTRSVNEQADQCKRV